MVPWALYQVDAAVVVDGWRDLQVAPRTRKTQAGGLACDHRWRIDSSRGKHTSVSMTPKLSNYCPAFGYYTTSYTSGVHSFTAAQIKTHFGVETPEFRFTQT